MVKGGIVFEFVLSLLAAARVFFSTRRDTALEVLALRQQVAVLKRQRPRPSLNSFDRLFWSLAKVDRRPRHRETGDRHRVAPSRFPSLLALALATGRRAA